MRAKLKLPRASRGDRSSRRVENSATAELPTTGQNPALTYRMLDLINKFLWPMVEGAFRDSEDKAEVRFFRLDELQVVISRAPACGAIERGAERKITLELWPSAGPRVLVVEWSGSLPSVVYRRDGDWLQSLGRISP